MRGDARAPLGVSNAVLTTARYALAERNSAPLFGLTNAQQRGLGQSELSVATKGRPEVR